MLQKQCKRCYLIGAIQEIWISANKFIHKQKNSLSNKFIR